MHDGIRLVEESYEAATGLIVESFIRRLQRHQRKMLRIHHNRSSPQLFSATRLAEQTQVD